MAVRNIIYDKIHPEIKRKGNIDHIILYALNAYGPMKRAEFISDPGRHNRMNKNTFHDHIRDLKNKGYINKHYENREAYYQITSLGEDFLSRILIDYELDFQTLLEIGERKRRNLIKRLAKFFEKYQVEDEGIKVEYIELANLISLDKKLKEWYSEDHFNRLLLFLILNHPKFYPMHTISINNFIEKYNKLTDEFLSEAQINFFIEQVIDKKKYNIGFHKLKLEFDDLNLYFREKSDYGKYFEITVDSKLKELVHNKNIENITLKIEDLEETYNEIILMLVDRFGMFHHDLKTALYSLIDKYRRNVKEQIIKRSITKIPEYAGIIALPEKPLEPKIIPLINEERKSRIIEGYEKEGSKYLKRTDKTTTISSDYELLKSSIKNIQYFHRESIFGKAWELYDQQDYKGALGQIDKLLRIEENPELYYWKAEILAIDSKLKKYDEALEIIDKGININPMPGDYNFYRLKAEILKRKGKYEEAFESIEKALELDSQPKILFEKVWLLIDLKKYDEAFNLALENSLYTLKEFCEYLVNYSDYLYDQKNYDWSMELNDKVIELNPKDVPNLILKAYNLAALKNFNEAINIIDKIIELNPNDEGIFHTKADFFEKIGNNEDALNSIQNAIELNQISKFMPFYYADKATILKSLDRYEDASKVIDKIIETYGYSVESYNTYNSPFYASIKTRKDFFYLIDLMIDLERYDDALIFIEEAIKSKDSYLNAFLHDLYKSKGIIFKRQKKYKEALTALDDAFQLYEDPDFCYLKAEIYLELNDYKNALNSINNAIEIYDQGPSYLNLKIDILSSLGEYGKILELVENIPPEYLEYPESTFPLHKCITHAAIKLIDNEQDDLAKKVVKFGYKYDPENKSEFYSNIYQNYYNKIFEEIEKKNYVSALEFIDRFLIFDDQDPKIHEFKITALIGLKDYDFASEIAIQANFKWPDYPEHKFLNLKAKILLLQENFNQSLELTEEIIKLDPNIKMTYQIKALNEMHLERLEDAHNSINKALEIDPNNLTSNQLKTDIFIKENKLRSALKSIDKCFEIKNDDPINFGLKSHILMFLNRHDEALEVLNRAIELFPNQKDFYNNRGLILDLKGSKLDALEDMKKAVELEEDAQGTYYNMTQILFSLERYEEALMTIEKAIELDPTDALSQQEKSVILAKLKRFDKALETQELVKELDPTLIKTLAPEHQVYTTMAYSFARDGKKKKAINSIKKAIEIDPEESEYYYSYGQILMIFNEYEEAINQFEKAKKLHFTPIKTYLNLGECQMILGYYDKALENLKIGRNLAAHSVKERVRTDEGYEIRSLPQTSLIERAERLIGEIERKS